MGKVCAITGAAGGIGVGAAYQMASEGYALVLNDINADGLSKLAADLAKMGVETYELAGDVTDRTVMAALADKTAEVAAGDYAAVINLAGKTPHAPNTPRDIVHTNIMTSVNCAKEFYRALDRGAMFIISSSALHYVPDAACPTDLYPLAFTDPDELVSKFVEYLEDEFDDMALAMAYCMSRHFIKWYVERIAFDCGERGLRVVSGGPGLVITDDSMCSMTEQSLADTASNVGRGRVGTVQEYAFFLSSVLDERNAYLSGVDILVDGGAIAGGFHGSGPRKPDAPRYLKR